ncbi:hypothetical protein ACFL0V_07390, partial [Nanoarchaeota archaeon]
MVNMHALTYSEREKRLFSGRRHYLSELRKNLQSKNSCITAPAGFGKKAILKELIEKEKTLTSFYFDLSRASISPESFAVEFIANICNTSADIKTLLDLKLNTGAKEIIKTIDNELQKIKPDQKLLIEQTLKFPEQYSTHLKKKILIILDNFQDFSLLNNYAQVKKATQIFSDTIRSQSVRYILSTSRPDKVIDSEFACITIEPLSKEESSDMIEKILSKTDARI